MISELNRMMDLSPDESSRRGRETWAGRATGNRAK